MKARLLLDRRIVLSPGVFAELVLWSLPTPLAGGDHDYKYRLALVAHGKCVLRYDNEAGKGGHIHRLEKEYAYRFRSVDRLIEDFMQDVKEWRRENRNA
jgi:hypothetical protein